MPTRRPSPLGARLRETEAEIAELRRKLAAKGDTDDMAPGEDEVDPGDVEPNSPPKKKKGSKKPIDDDEDEQPAKPDEPKPEDSRDALAAMPSQGQGWGG